ncbi:glycosyltransferase [Mucilaginibacter pallidiroseus]|uniref:Glycosyltransferase n=1 Tax=Mucilaginibacter pallidiroseus TaxID=2599295 RepID=A0A563U8C7_9SPHI|nr:glycosyltransferase [Mucilaginibacter pallidiroseus]TWR27595.1 glycosyltransferase [Mucilaginibacter pallidiroseus]
MKIAAYLYNLSGGGAEKIMLNFLNYVAENTEHNVTLILSKKEGQYLPIVSARVKIFSLNKSGSFSSLPALHSYLKNHPPDVLYSTLTNGNILSILVGQLLNIKVIIREANTMNEFSKSEKKIVDKVSMKLIQYLYKYAYKCIAISEIVKKDLLKFTNIPEQKIEVIHNPIIVNTDIEKTDVELAKDKFHICFVGRLSAQKNIKTIALLVEHFAKTNANIVFHFFGEGEEKYLLEEIVVKYNCSENIILHGFNLSFYSYLTNMDLFIHIPLWEGFGNSVLEAFNSGIPMILSNVESGYAELIKSDHSNVHYVEPMAKEKVIAIINDYVTGKNQRLSGRILIDRPNDVVSQCYLSLALN